MTLRRALKDILYEQVGHLVKGMANAKRLELVELLCQSPKSVETLATEAGISVKLASAHLKELKLAHLVKAERRGRQMIYHIACPEVAGLLVMVRTLAQNQSFELRHALKEIAASSTHWAARDDLTLSDQARKEEITLIDVRPACEYAERHLPHALSVPLMELSERLTELPKTRPVVAYCRGPFCSLSVEAVRFLREKGFDAFQWRGGAADWICADSSHMTTIRGV